MRRACDSFPLGSRQGKIIHRHKLEHSAQDANQLQAELKIKFSESAHNSDECLTSHSPMARIEVSRRNRFSAVRLSLMSHQYLYGVLVSLFLIGCQPNEPIHTIEVPKEGTPEFAAPGNPDEAVEQQMLAAMFPADKPTWFFKMMGPAEDVNPYVNEFDQLLKSISIPPGGKPNYSLPEGWASTGQTNQFRVATLRPKNAKPGVELTISQAMGSAAENIKRWAGQVGYTGDLATVQSIVKGDNVEGIRVDLSGTAKPTNTMAPFMNR